MSDEQNSANIAELEARGFTDPQLSRDTRHPWYDVSAGSCRLSLQRAEAGGWYLPGQEDVVEYVGMVDLATIRAHADELNLTHCFAQ